jgi:hypothetical protein
MFPSFIFVDMILMGSRAIRQHFPDFPREPRDTDYIGVRPELSMRRSEYHLIPAFENYPHTTLTPDDLYTLKCSHSFWDIKWEKTMFDIDFLKGKGCSLKQDLFDKLYRHWCDVHGEPKRSNLSMSSGEFFDNAVSCPHDHDHLHTIINPVPTYTLVLADGAEVDVSEEKFNALSDEQKLDLVREECYVMGYERLAGRDYRTAYAWMLKQMVLVHAPMFEAMFIIQNHRQLHKPIINFKEKIENEIQSNQSKTG